MRRYLRIPQLAAVLGQCVAGGAYLPALSDVILMVKGTSFMGLGGPNLVKGATGETIDGAPFISPATLRIATTVRTTERDVVLGFPMRWRLGYHMAATNRGGRPQGYGDFGLGGSGACAASTLEMAVSVPSNRMEGTPDGCQGIHTVGPRAVINATPG